MTYDFTSFSTVFQPYQDNDRMIIKDRVQWSPVYGWDFSLRAFVSKENSSYNLWNKVIKKPRNVDIVPTQKQQKWWNV